jgi:hypothetical protein
MLLLGCSPSVPQPSVHQPSVPLRVDATVSDESCCLLSYAVLDVVADPKFGTVDKATGAPLTWPRGYTARQAGSEVEVLNSTGKVVLTTGARYWLSPVGPPYDRFIIGEVKPCPDCELGGGPL